MLEAILFDYDDTLVRTKESKVAALQAVAERHYGVRLSEDAILRCWGIAYAELFKELFAAVEPNIAQAIQRYEALDDEFPVDPYPETVEVLGNLVRKVPVGIVTSASRSMVVPQLVRIGVEPRDLVLLQTAEDTPVHKPDPRVFEPALTTLASRAVGRERVLYVGDSIRDFEAAQGAGLRFCGMLRGTTTGPEFQEVGARFYHDLRALLDLV